ncbi:hypothetical protein [Alteromonas sp. H39]|uniref:hypothetical protein n=1 Tax=Alteromonas sp. H39 TaxID=3389876 RepID=UPI0039DFF491
MSIYSWLLSRFRTLKGLKDRLFWLKSSYLKLLLAVLSAFLVFAFFSVEESSMLSIATNIKNYGYLTEALAILILAFSLIKGWSISHTDVTFEKLAPIDNISLSTGAYDSCIPLGNQAVIYNHDANLMLEHGNNPLKVIDGKFQLHPLIYQLLPVFIMKMPEARLDTSDDAKVRLASDIDLNLICNDSPVNVQRTSYFRDRLSNTLANYLVKLDGRVILDLRNTEVITREGYFYSLRESSLSNQLGGSVLLFTADATIIVLSQGNRTAENAGRLAPAGSGSFDPLSDKAMEAMTFQDYARQEISRELTEECGLKKSDLHNVQLCGFGRYLYRNGKPEVFGIATTTKTSNEIKVPVREWDYQQKRVKIIPLWGDLSKDSAISALKKMVEDIENKVEGFENTSAPLYWNVLFAKHYLEHINKQDADRLFGLYHS